MSWVNNYNKKPVTLEPMKFDSLSDKMKYINQQRHSKDDFRDFYSDQLFKSRKEGIKSRHGRVKNK